MSKSELPSRLDVVRTDAIGDPAFVVDTRGIVISCNKEAARLLGHPARQILGRRCTAVVRGCLPTGEHVCAAGCPLVQGWGIQTGPPAVEMLVPGAGPRAKPRRVVVYHIPVRDLKGRASGVLHLLKPKDESPPNEPAAVTWSVEVAPPSNYLG